MLAERAIPDGVGSGESNSVAKRLIVSGPTAIHDATSAAQAFARDAGIDDTVAPRLAIVVEELVTNLFDHGGLTGHDLVHVELVASNDEITVTICDEGEPYDPTLARGSHQIPPRGGGAGIELVRAWATMTEYRTAAGQNQLTVTLPLTGRDQ
jgi:anti-sigma regulatory factor (Ser/Thr protein kinase)